MRRHCLCNRFIILFKQRLLRIQIRISFFDDVIYGANLASAFNFLDAFCQRYALRSLACNRNLYLIIFRTRISLYLNFLFLRYLLFSI